MATESLRIFDPRRNVQTQGFAGRAATTTLHDATATGVSISGIFQAAEDFAVLGLYNAYDYFNHLRLKHLPRTDLSGLALAFDIEYDHELDGAMRLDAAKYPSVSWDSMTFECGVGGPANTHEVRLLDHATATGGSETPASVVVHITGEENFDGGIDWLTLYFRDTRYTVTSTDVRVETRLTSSVAPDDIDIPVESTAGFYDACTIYIERTGTNEESIVIAGALSTELNGWVRVGHPAGSYVTRKSNFFDLIQKFIAMINTT